MLPAKNQNLLWYGNYNTEQRYNLNLKQQTKRTKKYHYEQEERRKNPNLYLHQRKRIQQA